MDMLGLGALPGMVPLLILALCNVPIAKFFSKCQFRFMIAQDERQRVASKVLNNMKVIKLQLQSWEEKFKSLIDSLREKEFR